MCTWQQLPINDLSLGAAGGGGTWYDATCSDGVYNRIFVPAGSAAVPTPVVSALTLAQQARNRLRLPAPAARHNPSGPALVRLATWWWVDPAGWRPLMQVTRAGAVFARVTATPTSSSWDAGDGSVALVCRGPGTPYDTARPDSGQATSCSHTYARSSAGQPQTGPSVNDRFFTVTVTTTWRVTWTGSAGSSGTLPPLTTSGSFPLAVAQRETVVTGGSS